MSKSRKFTGVKQNEFGTWDVRIEGVVVVTHKTKIQAIEDLHESLGII